MSALTRGELDEAGCSMPDCTHSDHSEIYLHGRCHMNAGTRVHYTRGTGVLTVACRTCGKLVARIAVAEVAP